MILYAIAGIISACVALALTALWQFRRTVRLSNPSGRFAVGRVSYEWMDASRSEIFSKDRNAKREMVVWIWYPAAAPQNAKPAPYLPERWARAIGEQGSNFRIRAWSAVQIRAIADAPVEPGGAPYPVLIFSPGYTTIPPDYTFLAEELASRGYVIVGVTPTYSARAVVFSDDRTVKPVPETAYPPKTKEGRNRLMTIWAADLVFGTKQLETLNADRNGRFFGRLDMERLGSFGHSFGGATALETARIESRCKAAVDIDGEVLGEALNVGVQRPLMFILAEPAPTSRVMRLFFHLSREADDNARAKRYSEFESVYRRSPIAYRLTLRGAQHVNFSDAAILSSLWGKAVGVLGSIDGRRGLKITADYVAAFFDRYLNDASSTLLDGARDEYREVQFESRRA